MKLYYVTSNANKVHTLQRSFNSGEVSIAQVSLQLPESRSFEVKEIAIEKIIFAYHQLRRPVIAMDAGFYIPTLKGFPRTYVHFALETIGIAGILKLVAGLERGCEFQECLAYLGPNDPEPKLFFGRFKGRLAAQPTGTMAEHLWSELSLIFIPENESKTLAEMDLAEYEKWYETAAQNNAADRQFVAWFRKNKPKKLTIDNC